jgi:hypothetical protein
MGFEKATAKIKSHVEAFSNEISYPEELNLSKIYDVYEPHGPKESYPNSGQPGVYCFISNDKVLYIGKSEGAIGFDIARYMPSMMAVYHNNLALTTISVGKHWFLAPALESFLIFNIKPILNIRGK